MTEPVKKRMCTICGTEHKIGEQCPDCGWDQEKEEKLAKAEMERKRLREQKQERKPGKSIFDY